jgi:hypothetical protein
MDNLHSIEFNDDNIDYESLNKFLIDDTVRKKNVIINDLLNNGEDYLNEVIKRRDCENQEKLKYIPYIIKNNKQYSQDMLLLYGLVDVIQIYQEIRDKEYEKSTIRKIFSFLFKN